MTTTITAQFDFDQLTIACDLAQASSPIQYLQDPDEDQWASTPYQVADARHDATKAVRLVLQYLGRDYYAAPPDEREDAEILDELIAGATIERQSDDLSRGQQLAIEHGSPCGQVYRSDDLTDDDEGALTAEYGCPGEHGWDISADPRVMAELRRA